MGGVGVGCASDNGVSGEFGDGAGGVGSLPGGRKKLKVTRTNAIYFST